MMDVVDYQRGGEFLFERHHFLNEREIPRSSEMKVSGGSGYEQGWNFPQGEGKGFAGSRTVTNEAELVASSESTVEDDDHIAELTRQMTHYMLQDDNKHALHTSVTSSEKNEESWGCVGWPSNSMTTMWSPLGSSSGSPEGPSEEPSPPVTPGKVDQAYSEHKSPPSYAAVLCRLDKLETNKQGKSSSGTTQVAEAENPKQGVAFDQSQEDSKIKQGRSSKKQSSISNCRQPKHIAYQTFESYNLNQNKVGYGANNVGLRTPPPIANSSPWLNNPSNIRAVYLGGSAAGARVGTPSCGTGVFLPCVIGNTSPSPKNKRGCAPVLIPAKVVQALKVHFDRVGDLPRQNPTANFPLQNDSLKGGRKTSTSGNRKRHSRGAVAPPPDMNNNVEMGLPQEWTY